MKIHFFEEYPTEENLTKAELLAFPSTIYLAAKSLREFFGYREKLSQINPNLKAAYWPILPKSYWLSPFSYASELENLKKELEDYRGDSPIEVLLDLELPILNKKLFFKNAFSFFRNKKNIRRILLLSREKNIWFATAEYPPTGRIFEKIFRILGVSYSAGRFQHEKIIMFYSSMLKKYRPLGFDIFNSVKNFLKKESSLNNRRMRIGLGTISRGALGNEPILSPAELAANLLFLKELNIKTAVIFRLGGLTEDYLNIINQFV